MNKDKLASVEEHVLRYFHLLGRTRLPTREIFDGLPEFANADIVRAFEDLEKRRRALVRYTEEGDDWVSLTPEGARLAGLPEPEAPPHAPPHPPKSST